jgi:hypothetical protein
MQDDTEHVVVFPVNGHWRWGLVDDFGESIHLEKEQFSSSLEAEGDAFMKHPHADFEVKQDS